MKKHESIRLYELLGKYRDEAIKECKDYSDCKNKQELVASHYARKAVDGADLIMELLTFEF